MKMEVLAVQQQFQSQYGGLGGLGSNKFRDWTSTLTPLTPIATATTNNNNNSSNNNNNNSSSNSVAASATATTTTTTTPYHNPHHQLYHQSHNHHLHHNHHRQMAASNNKMKNSINKKINRNSSIVAATTNSNNNNNNNAMQNKNNYNNNIISKTIDATIANNNNNTRTIISTTTTTTTTTTMNADADNSFYYCDNNNMIDAAAVNELSLRLLDELRAAKSRHLTCTEVSLPCDLTPSIAAEILRVSEKEPCGIRGCTIYIEFEDEPQNSRRIASLKLDPETVSTFEVYLTLRQDHRGWTALLPQFMKSLARTITISPEFTITKHKLYSPQQRSSYTATTATAAISTPSS